MLKSGKVLRADVCVVGVGKGCVGAEQGGRAQKKLEGMWQQEVPGAGRPGVLAVVCQPCWTATHDSAYLKKAFLEPPPQNATENIFQK